MALNPNHAFEELDGIKCSIVEKNCSPERADFLKKLLEFNKFTVVIANSPPPKAAPAKPAPVLAEGEVAPPPPPTPPAPPTTFTVGVTDISFNPISAIYNKELISPSKQFVDVKYWKQEAETPSTQKWYWEK
ncbi:hypothetical protein BH11BAC1_BH11BAC1_30050 [soil metagenome]